MLREKLFNKVVNRQYTLIIALIFISSVQIIASPPQIDPNNIFFLPSKCIYADFQAELEVMDLDGDYIFVFASHGDVVLDSVYIDDFGISRWRGSIDFYAEDICGQSFRDDFIISAQDTNDDTDTLNYGTVTFVGTMGLSMDDELYIWPGEEEWMPVYFDIDSCFYLGGFTLTIEFEDSVVDIRSVQFGDPLIGMESYFGWVEDSYGPGIDKFIFITDPDSNIYDIPPDEPALYLKFWLNTEIQYEPDYTTEVCFYGSPPYHETNSITDQTGYDIWYLNGCDYGDLDLQTECGNIRVLGEEDVLVGDVNLNGYAFEVGDMALAHNAVLDPINYPLTLRQRIAGNFDLDSHPLSIYDLFYLMSVLNGYIIPGGDLPVPYGCTPANDTLLIESAFLDPGDQFSLPVYLINHDTLFNFQAYLDIDTSKLEIDSLAPGDDIFITQVYPPGVYYILSYDFDQAWYPSYLDSMILPGVYHICDIVGSVKQNVPTPSLASIEFADLSNYLAYTGCVCSEYFEPELINSIIYIGGGGLQYLPGDANMYAGQWPPRVIGSDVTYLVNYFRGANAPCNLGGFWGSGDANGDCQIIGSDVTRLVSYFRGASDLAFCADFPTVWLSSEDLPVEAPSGWPNCEE